MAGPATGCPVPVGSQRQPAAALMKMAEYARAAYIPPCDPRTMLRALKMVEYADMAEYTRMPLASRQASPFVTRVYILYAQSGSQSFEVASGECLRRPMAR